MYFNRKKFERKSIEGYVIDGVKDDNNYYIFMSKTILCMDMCGDTPNIVWKRKISSDNPRNLILLKDKVIFDSGESYKNILEAADKETGERLWCYPGGEGILAAGNEKYLFLSPLRTDEIHIIKSSNGELQQKIKVQGIEEDWKARIKKVVVYQEECYCMFSSRKGLILTHIYSKDDIFTGKIIHIFSDMGDDEKIIANGKWLICSFNSWKGYDKLLAFNLETMQTEAQMKLPEEWYSEIEMLKPASKHNPLEYLVIFKKDFGGVAYIDLKQEAVRWYQGGKGRWDVRDACFSQGRVMAIARGEDISEVKDEEPKFVEINPLSGEWNYVSGAFLYWIFGFEDFLITDSFFSCCVYRWSEVEAIESTLSKGTETNVQTASEVTHKPSNNIEIPSQTLPVEKVNTEPSWSLKLEKYIVDNNLEELEKFYTQGTGISKISPQVMKYLKKISSGERAKGPIYFATLLQMFSLAPEDNSWLGSNPVIEAIPVLYLGHELYGYNLYLMPESGMVLSMHHDDEMNKISEIAERHQVNGSLSVALFCRSLENAYGICKLNQLLKLQKNLEDYKDFMDIPQHFLIRKTSEALRNSLEKLKKAVTYTAYQFLELDEAIINGLMLWEQHSKTAKENPEEIHSCYLPYLEGTTLGEEILVCKELEELDLSYNPQLDLQMVFEQLEKLPNLKKLILKKNELTTLPEGIGKLKNLRELILSNNNMEHIFNLSLASTLKFLDLRDNPVEKGEAEKLRELLPATRIATDGDGWKSKYPEWKEQYQEINRIRFLPYKNLEEFEALRMFQVKIIEPEISKCKKLKYLEFISDDERKLLEFSDSVGACENLETLIFRKQNRITFEDVIPKLKPLKKLKRLVLDSLSETTFPKELLELSSLEELEIKFSDHGISNIERIYEEYRQMTYEARIASFYEQCYEILGQAKQLRKLILRYPGGNAIPKDFGKELELEELVIDFSDSKLTDWSSVFQAISNMKTLKRLEVSYSKCREIPVEFGQLKNLEYLKLFFNKEIVDWNQALEAISGLTGLNYLDLSYNYFTNFPDCMKRLTNLTEIHMDANVDLNSLFCVCAAYPKLEYLGFDNQYFDGQVHIPENVGELKSLKVLKFYHNAAIKSFPKTMAKLINLEKLDIALCQGTTEQRKELTEMFPYCKVSM